MGSPSERTLREPLRVIRLHDPKFAPLDATGARLYGGRWNSIGANVIYAALTYGGAILETRVHAIAHIPPPREIAVITIPAGVRISEVRTADVPGWDDAGFSASRAVGDAWIATGRSLALIVPGKAGAPLEQNVVINLSHADAPRLHVESLGAVPWDTRLFRAPEPRAAPSRRKKQAAPPRRKK
jgi:RES domain-containing protein